MRTRGNDEKVSMGGCPAHSSAAPSGAAKGAEAPSLSGNVNPGQRWRCLRAGMDRKRSRSEQPEEDNAEEETGVEETSSVQPGKVATRQTHKVVTPGLGSKDHANLRPLDGCTYCMEQILRRSVVDPEETQLVVFP